VRASTNPDPDSWVLAFIEWWIDMETGFPIPERSGVLRWFIRRGGSLDWYDTEEEAWDTVTAGMRAKGVKPLSVTFISAKLEDNKILMQNDPDYAAKLEALPHVERMQLKEGNWLTRAANGDYFKREWFDIVDTVPKNVKRVLAGDLAATSGKGDWTVLLTYCIDAAGRRYIEDIVRFRGSPMEVENRLLQEVELLPPGSLIAIPQDPGQAGKAQAAHLSRVLAGYNVRFFPSRKSKEEMALPVSALAEAGNIAVKRAIWNREFFREAEEFPETPHDDQIDALSLADDVITKFSRPVSVRLIS
jgi:predicted phage terminase large subunit-like protein